MKCQILFSKKKNTKLSSNEFAQKVVNIKNNVGIRTLQTFLYNYIPLLSLAH